MGLKSRSGRLTTSRASASSIAKADSKTKQPTEQQPQCITTDNNNNGLFSKVIQPGYELSAEETLAAAHWIRQILAVFLGIVFGIIKMKGFPPVMTYVAVSLTTPYSLLSSLHELDLEEIGSKGTIQTEGFFPATALFFLSWIISYTIFLPST